MSAPPADVAVALQNLHQRYAVLTDEGRGKELAELFTDDVVWDGDELGYGRAEGPAAVAETVTRHFDPDRPMMHLPGPLLLSAVADDEVHGTSWCMATRWVDGQYALGRPELGLSNWQHGRLLARSGFLSGDSAYTIRSRMTQLDADLHR